MLYKELFLAFLITFGISASEKSPAGSSGFCSDEGNGDHLNCDVFDWEN